MFKLSISFLILLFVTKNVVADQLRMSSFEIGYTQFEFGAAIKVDGFEIKSDIRMTENTYISLKNSQIFEREFDFQLRSVGIRYKQDISGHSQFYSSLSLVDFSSHNTDENIDLSKLVNIESANNMGYEFDVGYRSLLTQELEVSLAYEYLEIENRKTNSLVVGSVYHFSSRFGGYIDYAYSSDISTSSIGIRFSF